MKLTNNIKRDQIIWFIIFIVNIIGLYAAIEYYKNILLTPYQFYCGCINKEFSGIQILSKTMILWIPVIYIALGGFLTGSVLSLISIFKKYIIRKIYLVGSLIAIFLIPYLIFLELNYNVICIYCTVMQSAVVISVILAIYSCLKS